MTLYYATSGILFKWPMHLYVSRAITDYFMK